MNGYIAFYKDKQTEVYAETSYKAQQLAAKHFNVPEKKRYQVTVMLAEKDGEPVKHHTKDL